MCTVCMLGGNKNYLEAGYGQLILGLQVLYMQNKDYWYLQCTQNQTCLHQDCIMLFDSTLCQQWCESLWGGTDSGLQDRGQTDP